MFLHAFTLIAALSTASAGELQSAPSDSFLACEAAAYELADALQSIDREADWQVMPLTAALTGDAEITLKAPSPEPVTTNAPYWIIYDDPESASAPYWISYDDPESATSSHVWISYDDPESVASEGVVIGRAACVAQEGGEVRASDLEACEVEGLDFGYFGWKTDDGGRADAFLMVTAEAVTDGAGVGCAVVDFGG
jgi:hypothetical protein